ncbi:outer membrane beta-barrel domain-containing protein, partial [Kaarinaea lacus]
SGTGLVNVHAADEETSESSTGIGIFVEGEKTEGGVYITPAKREQEAELETGQKNDTPGEVQIEKGSDQVIQPSIKRREVSVDSIDTEDIEIGVYAGWLSTEDFGTNLVVGARMAYHINEYYFTEFALGTSKTQETSYEKLSGGARLITDEERQLTYYNVSLGFNLLPGEAFIGNKYAFSTTLYVIGGVGITRFAGDDRFTINYGVGYRFLATDWAAFHFDVRDHVFNIDLLGEDKTTHNLETHGGITVFF